MIGLIRNFIDFVVYRTIKKYNCIKIKSLNPNYYDKDTLLLHGMMQLLVDYVEVELATISNNTMLYKAIQFLPWWIRPTIRSRELGLQQIKEIKKSLDYPRKQVEVITKIEKIYLWWKDTYPNRIPPEDIFKNIVEENYNLNDNLVKEYIKIEKDYYDEETLMLKQLIEIREHLWT